MVYHNLTKCKQHFQSWKCWNHFPLIPNRQIVLSWPSRELVVYYNFEITPKVEGENNNFLLIKTKEVGGLPQSDYKKTLSRITEHPVTLQHCFPAT